MNNLVFKGREYAATEVIRLAKEDAEEWEEKVRQKDNMNSSSKFP